MLPEVRKLALENHSLGKETIETLLQGSKFQLEHIISRGEASPEDFWYDQENAEWVLLLKGEASLEFEKGELFLVEGDAVFIDAHLRHRVKTASCNAVWLALHIEK